ncbi:unnamed protein product [Moneuplotes crassus]|uniref:Uncharacterized protein n=1 Tax=Euplotes crassus TaxID=5936 RepID=A0AAD1Y7K2_EUPCR|nr:unnamed protein product [Moneuplotes crassus]
MDNRLELVSKKFYHNIMEDNELLRRMLDNYLGIVKDYEREQEYQDSILDYRKAKQEENNKEEIKEPERKYIRYMMTTASIIKIYHRMSKKGTKLSVMCARSTGGHQINHNNIFCVFQGTGDHYNTCIENYFPNGLSCITGIPYSENPRTVENKASKLTQANELCEIYQQTSLDSLSTIRSGGLRYKYRVLYPSSSSSDDEEMCCEEKTIPLHKAYKRLENSSYKAPELIGHDKGNVRKSLSYYQEDHTKIIEFDISIQRELTREKLFVLDNIKIHRLLNCNSNIKAFALFVHDYPVIPEDHPLTTIVKVLYNSLEWNGKEASDHNINMEEIEPYTDSFNGFQAQDKVNRAQEIFDVYASKDCCGVFPEVLSTTQHSINFSQKFYSKKLNEGKIEEVKGNLKKMTEKIHNKSDFLPEIGSLDMDQIIQDSNYRLACIAYNLDTKYNSYTIDLPQSTLGRYVTILCLDVHDRKLNFNKQFYCLSQISVK